jgi:hypothetical protein
MAHQLLGHIQLRIGEAWESWKTNPGIAASDAEIAIALAVATGVAHRVADSAMNEAQIEFARKLIDQFAILPMPADEGV